MRVELRACCRTASVKFWAGSSVPLSYRWKVFMV
jgi:hypothetical protein